MKLSSLYTLLTSVAFVLIQVSCQKYYEPTEFIDEESALKNEADVGTATIGTYAVLKNAAYVRSGHFLMEYPGDAVSQGQSSGDDLTRAYRYNHINTSDHCTNFWSQAYKVIAAANKIIEFVPDNAAQGLLQLKGENLYLRAMMHFNLVRIFGRPYPQNGGSNPGIPILKEGLTDEEATSLLRSSVKDVYSFIIADLLKAADLMTTEKSNAFASKEVAYALLARVYLYQEDNDNAIKYANLVINSNRYSLLQGSEYTGYFRTLPESNRETIFCIRHTKVEDRNMSSIGSMYFSGDLSGNPMGQGVSGWAEIYASKKYYDFIKQNPQDLRSNFLTPYLVDGTLQYNQKLTPVTPMYYVNKYSLQEGQINLSSPVYLRLGEIYLIRAEAEAKKGNTADALADVNTLRARAGLVGEALYTPSKLQELNKSALDIVLEERFLELAFEGHRAYDLYRNNRAMERDYPGTHSLNNTPTTNLHQKVNPTDNRVVFYIPQAEINRNPKLTQNP
ncbi:RagB/SusD family nutrient uptake outer membrane protein [Sphingobacterium psychroaquaticum]|uniref:RagB/SusD family nutrient uptake outer membrane protein n=1 Tax=Sphingobacterium psychroaquaticum TaxID=561061 RepID=UPI00106C5A37|nr:RagB/SusD family nutrient uptake outer membrane protein [Sphingobacterium psychroaquaticum]QBQ40609.1 RagB/SusD family nutrient uptake outer membrane protein [Sphingobacterium psychroaquaticum]